MAVKLYLEADHHPILDGDVILASVEEGHSLSTKLKGTFGSLMPPQYRNFFESDITLKAEARTTKEGVTHLDNMVIQGKAMNVVANAEITEDGFYGGFLLMETWLLIRKKGLFFCRHQKRQCVSIILL